MDTQIVEHLSAARVRRDVQNIRDALSELSAGDVARAVIRSPRYGLYVVDGTVRTGVGNQLMLADVILGTGSEIQRIYPSIPEVVPTFDPEVGGALDGLGHGDLVRVTFATPAHGAFAITGPLTAGNDDFLLVGSWIVSAAGSVVPRVAAVERFPEVETHAANVPPLRSAIVEAASAPVVEAG
ncbi:hypothetical protein ACFXP7_13075 [Microbacterium sp. P06]|uniref:hypothetical protein n=1 Tax=unclassified Microbacterium TaxID=2609290 RepID=UPI003746FC17